MKHEKKKDTLAFRCETLSWKLLSSNTVKDYIESYSIDTFDSLSIVLSELINYFKLTTFSFAMDTKNKRMYFRIRSSNRDEDYAIKNVSTVTLGSIHLNIYTTLSYKILEVTY